MRRLSRATVASLLLLALGSCQPPPFPLDILVRNGTVLFWTEVEYKWFVWPQRPDDEDVCGLDVWTGREWVWRVELTPCRKGALPIPYGASGPGFRTLLPAKPLRPGLKYIARANTDWNGWKAFELNERRQLRTKETWGNEDPDDKAFEERRDKRIADLEAEGLTTDEAVEVWSNEIEPEPNRNQTRLGSS